jgi:NhaP-type Na+/H+ or K+/H+ antiporter
LVQNNFSCRSKKQEFKESVQNLLNHFIIFLLGTEHILQKFNQMGTSNTFSSKVIAAKGATEHNAFKNNIIFSETIH